MGHKIQRGKKGCIAPFKEIQNLQFGEFLLVESGIQHILLWNPESWALESWTQVKESRIPFKNWNLESKFHWQRIQNWVSGILNPRDGIKNSRMIGGLDVDQCLGPTPSAVVSLAAVFWTSLDIQKTAVSWRLLLQCQGIFFFLRCPSVNSRHTKRAAPIPSLQCLVVYPAMTQEGIGWGNGNQGCH